MYERLVVLFGGIVRSKLSITGITNTGQDQTGIRDFVIHHSRANVDIRMRLGELLQASFRRDDANDVNLLDAPLKKKSKKKS